MKLILKTSCIILTAVLSIDAFLANAQNVDTLHCDFLMVNINKSVLGSRPSGEFSEVAAKLSYTPRLFSLYSLDINLADTSGAIEKDLAFFNQALISLNFGFLRDKLKLTAQERSSSSSNNPNYNREFFVSAVMKGFNYEPYVGIGIGSLESNKESKLFTTYFILSYLRSFFKQNLSAEPGFYDMSNIFFHHNLYMEFAIKLNDEVIGNKKTPIAAGFLTNARLKAGLLVPLNMQSYSLYNNPQYANFLNKNVSDFVRVRITLQVPIGGIIRL